MSLTLFASLFFSFFSTHAQIEPFLVLDNAQSSSSYHWKSLENDFVEVLFPEGWESEAQRSAFLVEHYSKVVGESLKIEKPEKFPLILRPEMALPNGFVTLAPRRSEWFLNQSFSPFLGGLDFVDVLAIHEYRHVNQFDFSYRSTNKLGYYLFGEYGLAILLNIGMPNWYFEGDAVWAETKYTKAGRGRSPRFNARLKALILSGQTPTYDELVGGTFKTDYPNHYVYGYYIVARAYRLFGEDFWYKVFNEVSDFAINPYQIYKEFELISGTPFETFVRETFEELKSNWQSKGDSLPEVSEPKYTERRFPLNDGKEDYYLEKKLNGFWTLKSGERELIELDIRPDLSKVDIKASKLAYTQFLPHYRFGYKGRSDLFIYDIEKDETSQITSQRILYHPQWSPDAKELVVIEKERGATWSIKTYKDEKWSKVPFDLGIPLEATYKNNSELYVLYQNEKGERALGLVDLENSQATALTPFTRVNLYSLRAFNDDLLFEGDWQGRVQVISMGEKGALKACTNEPVMARNPSGSLDRITYAAMDGDGEKIKEVDLSKCQRIDSALFWDQRDEETLSVAGFGESKARDYDLSLKKDLPLSETSLTTRGLSPNSWSFIGGRGFQAQIQGSNYLGDISYLAVAGQDSEEETPFGEFHLSYNKYLITTSLYGIYEKRDTRLSSVEGDKEWNEFEYGLRLAVPLTWVDGLYTTRMRLGAHLSQLKVSDRYGIYSFRVNDEKLDVYGAAFSLSHLKRRTYQQIYPEYGASFKAFYRNIDSDRRDGYGTYLTFLEGSLFLPGLWENAGLRIRGVAEIQDDGLNNYRHDPVNEDFRSYVFSRGFNYNYVDQYVKGSADYAFPLLNTDWNLAGWHYIKRLYMNLFYDQTRAELLGRKYDLKSFGGELNFQATWFRRLPLDYGVRYSKKIDSGQRWDFFLGTQLSF
ncbi:MAG: hypothetical protein VXV96_18565 [Bdellovibrionota bacterium]|nr:hypothetical protein [Bdellovibrionota bacterium]